MSEIFNRQGRLNENDFVRLVDNISEKR